MAGTGELDGSNVDVKLATLLERSKTTEKFAEVAGRALTSLSETIQRIERTQIEQNTSLTARSEANSKAIAALQALVEHKAGSSIERDKQQVYMLREEERIRKEADDRLRSERQEELDEQAARHDAEIAAINLRLDKMADKLDNAVFWARIMAGVAALAGVVAGAAVSALFRILVP